MDQLLVIHHTLTPSVTRRQFHGREHLVVPVVAIVEGVLNNEYVPADEIARFVEAWNYRPLPIGHPSARGVPISANSPDLIEAQSAGHFFNASFAEGKLKGEMWVDVEKAKALGGDALKVLELLEAGQPLEVSTAYFRDIDPTTGTFNGKEYASIARNLRPDHLALLPNAKGACSWEDGCGAPRINAEDCGCKEKPNMLQRLSAGWAKLARAFGVNVEQSHQEIESALRDALRLIEKPDGNEYCYLVDVYDDTVVYQKEQSGQPSSMYQRAYTLDDNGTVSFGEAQAVVREVRYLPMKEQPATNTDHATAEETMKKELIDALIANAATQWAEADRPELEKLDEAMLKKLSPVDQPKANTERPEPKPEEPEPEKAAATPPAANVTYPPAVQELIDQDEAARAALVTQLAANKACPFVPEKLKGMSRKELEGLSHALTGTDYTGRGGPRPQVNTQQYEFEPAPGDEGFKFQQAS